MYLIACTLVRLINQSHPFDSWFFCLWCRHTVQLHRDRTAFTLEDTLRVNGHLNADSANSPKANRANFLEYIIAFYCVTRILNLHCLQSVNPMWPWRARRTCDRAETQHESNVPILYNSMTNVLTFFNWLTFKTINKLKRGIRFLIKPEICNHNIHCVLDLKTT